jgi:hypothetical protein
VTQTFDTQVPPLKRGEFKFKRKGRGEYIVPSSAPIDFSEYSDEYLEEIWSRYYSSKFDDSSLLHIDSNLSYEIRKCYRALCFWEDTPGAKRYTKEEILRSTLLLGPSYAEKLSDEWDYGIRRSHRVIGVLQDYEDWQPVRHYNELPPVSYLIRWKETSNDIEYMKIPLQPFDKDLMEELKNEILENLPDNLEFPTDIEIFAEVKTSTTLDLDRMKSIPFYKGRLTPEGTCFSQIFKARRSIVPVGPANTRDALVTTIDTYNSVKKCDLVLGTILDDIEESLVCSSSQEFKRRIDKASATPRRFGKQLYWLRDIKKCGLTFPRELIHLLQECLSETYPDKDFSFFNIYRNYSIFDEDGKPIKTHRGYGLGMANNCITFIQCMLYNLISRRIPEFIHMESFFGNDDSLFKVWIDDGDIDPIDAMMIQDIDYEILNKLNVIVNDKKSFWSHYPIIFEEYGKEEFKKKDSRLACALSSALLAPDIKYAKMLTSSISMVLWDPGDWIATSMARISDYWGYEYYPEESSYDYSLGGWLSIKSKGCSLALRQIMNSPDDIKDNIWLAVQEVSHFQTEVLKPILKGSVTKNYSVTGSILNVTYVDIDLYDIPELPVEMIYLDRKGYEDFYESIYRFNRNPYAVISSRLKRITAYRPAEDIDRVSICEYLMSRNSGYAIPEQLVLSSTPIFEIDESARTDCNSLMRNCLSRYIEELRLKNLITCSPLDIDASGEYPYVSTFDRTPFTDRVNKVTTLDGYIPSGIYQYTTNPWLVLSEYYHEYDNLPLSLLRLVGDKAHLPIWFMTKQYRNSREISMSYNLIDQGEETVDLVLSCFREEEDSKLEKDPDKEIQLPDLCFTHRAGYSPWDKIDDIFNTVEENCILCILENQLWSARKRSTLALKLSERYDAMRDTPKIRSRIEHIINKYFPLLVGSISDCTQQMESNDLFGGSQGDSDEEGLLNMF